MQLALPQSFFSSCTACFIHGLLSYAFIKNCREFGNMKKKALMGLLPFPGNKVAASLGMDNSVSTSDLLDNIIKTAVDLKASDIHLEPREEFVRLRYRVDG